MTDGEMNGKTNMLPLGLREIRANRTEKDNVLDKTGTNLLVPLCKEKERRKAESHRLLSTIQSLTTHMTASTLGGLPLAHTQQDQ